MSPFNENGIVWMNGRLIPWKDEVFFTGSAAEITPIRSVDRITVGAGRRGPVTEKLQEEFFAVINGAREDKYHWLTYL